jgi:hypothetical protein
MGEIGAALGMAFVMGWEILWPLVLGFVLSGVVQAVVTQSGCPRPSIPGTHRSTFSRSCGPRPHPRSGAQETAQNLPGRSPASESQLHPGYREISTCPSTATRSAPGSPITWSCVPERCAPASASAILRSSPKKPAPLTPPTTRRSTGTNPT